jgi:hypothetical protein
LLPSGQTYLGSGTISFGREPSYQFLAWLKRAEVFRRLTVLDVTSFR